MNKKLAPVFVILAGCFWGSIGIFVRRLNALGLGSMEIVESRAHSRPPPAAGKIPFAR